MANSLKATDKGFINKNGQLNLGSTGKKGTSNQTLYQMQCPNKHIYSCNGANIRSKVCPICDEIWQKQKMKKPEIRQLPKGGINLSYDAVDLLSKCTEAIRFSTVSDVILNDFNFKKDKGSLEVHLHCGISFPEKIHRREGKLVFERGFHDKQIRVLRPILLRAFKEEIQKLLPQGEIHFTADKGEILILHGKEQYDIRYAIDRWTASLKVKPSKSIYRIN